MLNKPRKRHAAPLIAKRRDRILYITLFSRVTSKFQSLMEPAQEVPSRCGPVLSHLGRPTLCDVAEELRCHILSFLTYSGIICCASTCKTMYQTVKTSIELQYIIELGAQRLIPAHPRSPNVSVTECLRILRDKANMWNSFKLNTTKSLRVTSCFSYKSICHQQLSLSDSYQHGGVASKVIDLRTCTPETASLPPRIWSQDDASPVSGTSVYSRYYIDGTQDLMVTVNVLSNIPHTSDFMCQINFRMISTGGEHPLAHGSRLVKGKAPRDGDVQSHSTMVTILGDRLALYVDVDMLSENEEIHPYWMLHVWNWYKSDQSDDICVLGEDSFLNDIRFLTKEKLLCLTPRGEIELYNVEDLSKAPQLEARFALPVSSQTLWFEYPSTVHSAASCAHVVEPDEQWIWTTAPADRVISVASYFPWSLFVISARLFFMDVPPIWFDLTSENGRTVPWTSWGPQNSRCFLEDSNMPLRFGVGGTRVIRAVLCYPSILMRMYDFNPSAVARGIGKVVRKPTTFRASIHTFKQDVTTCLPYVEVANNDREFDGSFDDITLDEEKVLIFSRLITESQNVMDVEIIGM